MLPSYDGKEKSHAGIGKRKAQSQMTAPNSTARAYFERFTKDGTSDALKNLPNEPLKTFETNWLDFKGGSKFKPQHLSKSWSKALGAFANTEGGVVVYGIDAREIVGVDATQEIDQILNIETLISDLHRYAQLTNPPLVGVEIVAIPLVTGGKEGFVVCYIPQGSDRPYESTAAERPYYMRAGNESVPMPRSFLEQLFNPKLRKRACLIVDFKEEKRRKHPKGISFSFMVLNVGRQTIRNPCVSLSQPDIRFQYFSTEQIRWIDFPPNLDLQIAIHPQAFGFFQAIVPDDECSECKEIIVSMFQDDQVSQTASFRFDFDKLEFPDGKLVATQSIRVAFIDDVGTERAYLKNLTDG